MIYHASCWLQQYISALNVVHYITFRTIAALLQALIVTLVGTRALIKKYQKSLASDERECTPLAHKHKKGTPTMGGLVIIGATLAACLCWCDLARIHTWILVAVIVSFGAIGFWDDWHKLVHKRGISAREKWIFQILFALLFSVVLLVTQTTTPHIAVPFFKNVYHDLGIFFIPWAIFVIVGTSNAVNLTDGLDGLAAGVLLPTLATLTVLGYLASHCVIALYLHIPFTSNPEAVVIGGSLIGSMLGFLWYNAFPAQIIMGDVGSLALGAGLATMAIMAKQEVLLAISGGIFVVETLSVIVQVLSFKLRGKRVFKMAPLHHHFELQGLHETTITTRFMIVSVVLSLLALVTLKIR